MSKVNNILKDLEDVYQDILYIRSEIENTRFEILPKDKEKIFEKHLELATSFGILETTLNKISGPGF